ncbi:acidic mammalian chitinase-like, partial [Pollicipes pollicipes]|uniref:acidic mammalian chitinase-like n=1 Tax=Pollicipes pollicipes TaxID=41117 RepID=UPI001885895C
MASLLGLGVLLTITAAIAGTPARDATPYKVVCYFESWAVYRTGKGKYDVEDIDPYICTHYVYTFAGLKNDHTIVSLDPWNDLYADYGRGAYLRFTRMKQKNPEIKTMLSIGGWNEGSRKYSQMASTAANRKKFINSVVKFLHKFNFDGLDLDWEYPTLRGGAPDDVDNYSLLLKELHERLNPLGLLLSAAVSAGKQTIDPAYHLADLNKYLDIVNVMTYDYHGDWDPFIGHNSPLYLSHLDVEHGNNFEYFSVNYSMNYYLRVIEPSKLMLGMPFYGRGFVLANSEHHTPYDPSNGPMAGCPYSGEPGFCGYNELCEKILKPTWTYVRDSEQKVIYGYKGNTWVGWDDLQAVKLKMEFLKSLGLGGAMIWAIDSDDFRGVCGPKYPLLNLVWSELNGAVPSPSPLPTT